MEINNNYWGTLTPPLAPDKDDIDIYARYLLGDNVLLLGCTKQLMPLSTIALDIDPYYSDEKIQIGSWSENTHIVNTIIGDGCFNIIDNKEVNLIVDMAGRTSKRLIVRSFIKHSPIMKVAFNFPTIDSFDQKPDLVLVKDFSQFFIWNF